MASTKQALKDAGFGFRNEYGLTAKQEQFCQFIAIGDSQADAYRKAFDVKTAKPETIWQMASKMSAKPMVKARVNALFKEQSATMVKDAVGIRKHVFNGLLKESQNDDAKPGERIKALVALGQIDIVGMFREKTSETAREVSPEELERELRDRLASFFGRMPEISPAREKPDQSNGDIIDVE